MATSLLCGAGSILWHTRTISGYHKYVRSGFDGACAVADTYNAIGSFRGLWGLRQYPPQSMNSIRQFGLNGFSRARLIHGVPSALPIAGTLGHIYGGFAGLR